MLSFLKLVFGPDITVKGFDYTDDTPYYIKDGYTPQLLSWGDHACVLLKPNGSSWRLPTLKKQLKKFQELCSLPLCTVLRQPVCVTTTEYAGRTHPVCVSFRSRCTFRFGGALFMSNSKDAAIMAKWHPVHSLYFYIYTMQRILGP